MQCFLMQSLEKDGLGLECHSAFSFCLCQFTSLTHFPEIKCRENRNLRCPKSILQLDYPNTAKQLIQTTHSFLWTEPSPTEVWLWVSTQLFSGLQCSYSFSLGGWDDLSGHFRSHHFLAHLNKLAHFLLQISWFFLSYCNLSATSVGDFQLDLDISVGKGLS